MRRDVFQAIADPTRRQIINMVAHKSLNLNSVAEQFEVSRPAISKHIKILTECGLVVINQKGRERFCEAKVEKLTEVSDWVEQFREMWEAKFDSLDKYLTKLQAADTKPKPAKTRKKTKQDAPETNKESGEPENQYSLF
ncbi:MAG: helix-turn-helix transcriptional regulator [Roseivirga sp.]|nr:helix-turn-helix transcriptional regulator [Roseivirga sp.]